MRRNLRRTVGYGDRRVDALAKDVFRAFESIRDESEHVVSLVWNPPTTLLVPFFGGENRLSPPKSVRCDRAVDVSGDTYVTPGGCAWRWLGSGQVELIDVSGLVVGTKYELVFTVVG